MTLQKVSGQDFITFRKTNPMKSVIIIQHGGGELANQLWNFASIYAYCKERGFDCKNYSFFEYGQYFNIPITNPIVNFIFFKPFTGHHKRRNSFKTKFWRFIYKLYVKIIMFLFKNHVVSSVNIAGKKYYLPPTAENKQLETLVTNNNTLYFTGWLFRNPQGMLKHRKEIIGYLKPKKEYTLSAEKIIADAKTKYKNIIGVHIRQTDYRTHKNGKYFIPQKRVREIMDEYLVTLDKKPQETLFVVTSDEPISEDIFKGLNTLTNKGNAIEDLYMLSLCDVIIGSNSSFGNFAAYYGNKPHIILQNEKIDWEYYKGKNDYFENKYSVMFT